jgi:hypothetical protein
MVARTASSPRRRALGLSLVEILVGVAIGLIGIVAIFQAVAVWSKHTSTTSSGGDAQVAGTLAPLQPRARPEAGRSRLREGRSPVLGCDVAFVDNAPARAFNFGLRPVDDRGERGGAPDTITILYGDSSFYGAEGTFNDATATTKKLRRRAGFKRATSPSSPSTLARPPRRPTASWSRSTRTRRRRLHGRPHRRPVQQLLRGRVAPQVAPRFNGASAPW